LLTSSSTAVVLSRSSIVLPPAGSFAKLVALGRFSPALSTHSAALPVREHRRAVRGAATERREREEGEEPRAATATQRIVRIERPCANRAIARAAKAADHRAPGTRMA